MRPWLCDVEHPVSDCSGFLQHTTDLKKREKHGLLMNGARMSESSCNADGLTCNSVQVLLVRFDTIGETHLSFHTHGLASVMLAQMLRLLQVDFDRVEGHVGVELCNISGPGERETITANSGKQCTCAEKRPTNGCISSMAPHLEC